MSDDLNVLARQYLTGSTQETKGLNAQARAAIQGTQQLNDAAREYLEAAPSFAPPSIQEPLVNPDSLDYTKIDYGINDLTSDTFLPRIRNYLKVRYGTQADEYDDERAVEAFIHNMRGFNAGNSVRTVEELGSLSSATEEEKAVYAEAYNIWDNMDSAFTDDGASWLDAGAALIDYTRTTVLDPVNVLSLGIGKAVGTGASKSAAVAGKHAAQKAFRKSMAVQGQREVAETAAMKAFGEAGTSVAQNNAAKRVAREQIARSGINKLTVGAAGKEAMATIAFDSAAAVAVDKLYQNVLEDVGIQEGYNLTQGALTGVLGLVSGGLLYGVGRAMTRKGSSLGPDVSDLKTNTDGVRLSNMVSEGLAPEVESDWAASVARGVELEDLDTDFWLTMVNGNEELGVKGLPDILLEQGYVWQPRSEDDKITKYLADVIKDTDPQDYKKFIEGYSKATGIPLEQMSKLSQEQFADTFMLKARQGGQVGQALGQASKDLGIAASNVTGRDVVEDTLGDTSGVRKLTQRTQGQIIRGVVSNLSTTAFNLAGFAGSLIADGGADAVNSVLLAPKALVDLSKGGGANSRQIGALVHKNLNRIKNTVDPFTTHDQFIKYVEARPKALRELTHMLPGGVENIPKFADEMDVDQPLVSQAIDKGIDFLQTVNLVKAQDGMTKGIEFLAQLDSLIRKEYGMSYKKFLDQDDYWGKMRTPEFAKLEREAVTNTLDAIYSRDFAQRPVLGKIAGGVEAIRNVPVVGLAMPFGRFFNNTVAFMSDYTGASFLARAMGMDVGTESTSRKFSRGAAGWITAGSSAAMFSEGWDKGLAWNEMEVDGNVVDQKLNFPLNMYMFMGYAMHKGQDEMEKMSSEFATTFGLEGFTRGATDTLKDVQASFQEVLDDPSRMGPEAYNTLLSFGANAVGMATRGFEPFDAFANALRDNEGPEDQRQGAEHWNNATRHVDQLFGLESEDQRMSPTRGPAREKYARFMLPQRSVRVTNLSRLANLSGMQEWTKQIRAIGSTLPEASNRYNELYFDINEAQAARLLRDPHFREANAETKKLMANEMFTESRDRVKALMEANVDVDDAKFNLAAKIEDGNTQSKLSKTMQDLGFAVDDLLELDIQELYVLEEALKYRDDILLLRE